MKVKRQTSAGGVVMRRDDGLQVCLINPRGRRIWALPKGAIEDGESPEAAAVREVREETGIEGVAEEKLGVVEYWFYSREDKRRIHKSVHFFLVHSTGGDVSKHDHEVSEARWVRLDDALGLMAYPNEREMVRTAAAIVRSRNEAASR